MPPAADAAQAGVEKEYEVNAATFFNRFTRLHDQWKAKKAELWKSADCVLIMTGKNDDEAVYDKAVVVETWLFDAEFPETILLLTPSAFIVLSSAKKIALLEKAMQAGVEGPVPIKLLKRTKEDKNAANYSTIIDAIKESGGTLGVVEKSSASGELVDGMKKAIEDAQITKVDVRDGLADLLSTKEEAEIDNIRRASGFTSSILRFLVKKIEGVIDEEKVVKHSDLAKEVEEAVEDPKNPKYKLKTQVKIRDKMEELSVADIDSCFPPIIQSGGKFDLKPSADSSDEPLHAGTVVCSIGTRYKCYCSHIARTYLINATKEQKEVYGVVVNAQKVAVRELRDGVRLNAVFEKVVESVRAARPDLLPFLTASFGVGIGIEFREAPAFLINGKNAREAKAGMTFSLSVGVSGVPNPDAKDPKNKTFAVLLADTVLVQKEKDAELLTKVATDFAAISYAIEEAEPKKKPEASKASGSGAGASSSATSASVLEATRLRVDTEAQAAAEQRKRNQQEIARKRNEEAAKKYAQSAVDSQFNKGSASMGDIDAYRSPADYPKEAVKNQIYVDVKREAILCPINGIFVPFHISTIRNVGKSDEGRFTYLRINFFTPGNQMPGQTQGLQFKENTPYVRELSYRSLDPKNINNTVRIIKELRKRVTSREQENRDRASLVEQESLVLYPKGTKTLRLGDLQVRPNLSGRKTTGVLELHTNGLRFTSIKGETVDVVFKNVKHAFFQESENEIIVCIHFHLHSAIMIGKKKTNDVQFFREVMEGSQALESSRRQYDAEEIEEEDRERKRRHKINQEFEAFIKKVEEEANRGGARLEWDIPYRDIGFNGTPNRSQVFLMPTVRCLVDLIDSPPFVVTMSEVEIAHFERVVHSLRNFDLVFVFKNFERPVVRINAIPMECLDNVRKWLDTNDVQYHEGTANLNWNNIMKTIRADPKKFYEDGGWNFLNLEESDEEKGGEGEGSEDSQSYKPTDEESGDEGGSDDDEDTSMDEEESEAEGSEEEGSEGGSEEEEPGMSWSDLEEEAREDDRRRDMTEEPDKKKAPAKKRKSRDDEEEDFGRSKKKVAPAKGAAKPAGKPAPPPPKASGSKPPPPAGKSSASSSSAKPGAPPAKPAPAKPSSSSSSAPKPGGSKPPGPGPSKPPGSGPSKPPGAGPSKPPPAKKP